jgi:hypothetical protein
MTAFSSGRPYVPPFERIPYDATVPPQAARVGWLLAANRIGRAAGHPHRDSFLTEADAHGIRFTRSQLSRWESGSHSVTDDVVLGYERVLGLTPYSLLGAVDAVPGPPTVPTPRLSPEDVDASLDAALLGDLPGLGWRDLSVQLSARAVHLTHHEWRQFSFNLAVEAARTQGVEGSSRTHAVGRMLRHRVAVAPLVAAVLEVATDASSPSRAEVIRQLRFAPAVEVVRPLMHLLHSADEVARQAACDVTASMLSAGLLAVVDLNAVSRTLFNILRSSTTDVHVIDAILRLPATERRHFERLLGGASMRSAVKHFEVAPVRTVVGLSRELALAAEISGPLAVASTWHVDRFVREGAFAIHHARRTSAVALLAASPWAHPLRTAVEAAQDGSDSPAARALRRFADALDLRI